jgi:hypothetical protein
VCKHWKAECVVLRCVLRRAKGWIGDFFAYFEKAISVLTEKVKAFVLNTGQQLIALCCICFSHIYLLVCGVWCVVQ